MKFRPIVVGLLLFSMFALAMITGGIQLANVNDVDQSIGDHPLLSTYSVNLSDAVGGASDNAKSGEDAFADSDVTLSTSSVFIDAIGGIWKTLKTIPVTIYNLTIGLVSSVIFGGGAFSIVLGIIGAILTITIIFAVWRLISTGEGG